MRCIRKIRFRLFQVRECFGSFIDHAPRLVSGPQCLHQENARHFFHGDISLIILHRHLHRRVFAQYLVHGCSPDGLQPLRQIIAKVLLARHVGQSQVIPQVLANGLQRAAALCDALHCSIRFFSHRGGEFFRRLDELFLEFQLDGFPDDCNAFLRVHNAGTFHQQVFFVAEVRRRYDSFAHAERVDAPLQHGANGFDHVCALLLNIAFFQASCGNVIRRCAASFHRRDLFINLPQLIFHLFLGNAEIELRAADQIQTKMQFRILNEARSPSFPLLRQCHDDENEDE